MTDSQFSECFKEAVDYLQNYYDRNYTPSQIPLIAEQLRWEIPPLRLMKIAKHLTQRERHTLPLVDEFIKANDVVPYSSFSSKYKACPDCDDTGVIRIKVDRGQFTYTEMTACHCAKGDRHVRDFKSLRSFNSLPDVQEAVKNSLIYFRNGTAYSTETDEIVTLKILQKQNSANNIEEEKEAEIPF